MKNIHEMASDYVGTYSIPSSTGDFKAVMDIAVTNGYLAGANYVLEVMEKLLDDARYPDEVKKAIQQLKQDPTQLPPFYKYTKALDTPATYEEWRLAHEIGERFWREGKDPDEYVEEIKHEVEKIMTKSNKKKK